LTFSRTDYERGKLLIEHGNHPPTTRARRRSCRRRPARSASARCRV
jgi:hypothetical protein